MRTMTRLALIALIAVGSGLATLQADTLTWVGPTTGGTWQTAANWQNTVPESAVPTAADSVIVASGNTVEVNSPDAVLYAFANGSGGTVNINSGGVLTGGHGYTLRYISTVNVNDGGTLPAGTTWDIRCNVSIADGGVVTGTDNLGTYTYGATLSIDGTFSPRGSTSAGAYTIGGGGDAYYGRLRLHSTGTLNLDVFGNGDNEYLSIVSTAAGAELDLSSGTVALVLQGGYTPQIGDSFNLWDKVAGDAVVTPGDGSNISLPGYTLDLSQWASDGIVTIIPEPATLGLLAVGGLALLKRRR